jgi:hypothetical protein
MHSDPKDAILEAVKYGIFHFPFIEGFFPYGGEGGG